MSEPKKTTAFILGEILATLANIEEKMGRLVFRADDAEKRIEKLELKNAASKWHEKAIDKVLWASLGAVVFLVFKAAGLHIGV